MRYSGLWQRNKMDAVAPAVSADQMFLASGFVVLTPLPVVATAIAAAAAAAVELMVGSGRGSSSSSDSSLGRDASSSSSSSSIRRRVSSVTAGLLSCTFSRVRRRRLAFQGTAPVPTARPCEQACMAVSRHGRSCERVSSR